MLSLALFCLFYFTGCHQCNGEITISEGTCNSKDGDCFGFQFDTLESLREKLKRDVDLRAVLERFVQVERQHGGGTSECLYTGASQTSTVTSQPDKGDTTPNYYECLSTTAVSEQECDPEYYECSKTPINEAQNCERKWWNMGSLCVRFSKKMARYANARSDCIELDGRLAAKGVRDGTMAASPNFTSISTSESNSKQFWIGLERSKKENWKWSDNCTYRKNETNWDAGQPGGPGGNEYCALLQELNNKWIIHDYPCGQKYHYICEKTQS